ncbi:MAG: hypothetical protein U0736_04965 [Gemmataceae bacterium]
MTLIVPGLLARSRGPLYYPAEEVARNPQDWDGCRSPSTTRLTR